MEPQDDVRDLLDKHKAGTLTDTEKAVLDKWYLHVAADSSEELSEEARLRTFDEVLANIQEVAYAKGERRIWPGIAAAASVLLCLGLGYYYFKPQAAQQQVAKTVIKPGSNKAVLTLANGQQIDLDDATQGELAKEAGIRITKDKSGQITYVVENNSGEVKYNTTATPKGGQWHLVLQDGTEVWLNAASSLKYPTAFTDAERKVELVGEGYFEVVKDKAHPFIVTTAKQTVTVLGTHFNINSYQDEPSTRTTLLEGSVNVNGKLLKPGQQAVLSDHIEITEGDEDAIAWKNGLFVFHEEDLGSVLRKVERWYDVDFVFDQEVSQRTFSAAVGRFDDIQKILSKIAFVAGVHFKTEGRRITVTK